MNGAFSTSLQLSFALIFQTSKVETYLTEEQLSSAFTLQNNLNCSFLQTF